MVHSVEGSRHPEERELMIWKTGKMILGGKATSQRTSDNQGLEGEACAGLEERGQILSKEEVKVEHKVSVAIFTSRDENCKGEGREDDTAEERWEGESERRFRPKITGRGVGGVWVVSCKLKVMRKLSEMWSGFTKMLPVMQLCV